MKNSIKMVFTFFLLTGWPAILTNTIDRGFNVCYNLKGMGF